EIKELKAKIDQVLAQEDVQPYVQALEQANKELTGRGLESPTLDASKVKFKKTYEQMAKNSGIQASQDLVQILRAVDQADDPDTKRQRALEAKEEVKKFADQLSKAAMEAQSEEVKLASSRLATDLRKLQQTLQEVAK